ncbi:MAG TPA: zf-HC2 domain-containing protein [Terriglobales bacterium]|nr:zf-HC2 domain-containing protein [Terriglobales bacterium]
MLSLDLQSHHAADGVPPAPSRCHQLQAALSAYVDGELPMEQSGALIHHLDQCGACSARVQCYRGLRQGLQELPAPAAPTQLALRLRVEASHYSVRGQRWQYLRLRLGTAIRAMALPAAVGTASALFLFSALAGGVRSNIVNDPLRPDVVVGGNPTPPRLTSLSDYGVGAPVLVEAQIDATGHVYGYSVLAGPTDAQLISRLNNQLLMSVFQPATTNFGQPTTGSLLVSFGTVEVRG